MYMTREITRDISRLLFHDYAVANFDRSKKPSLAEIPMLICSSFLWLMFKHYIDSYIISNCSKKKKKKKLLQLVSDIIVIVSPSFLSGICIFPELAKRQMVLLFS